MTKFSELIPVRSFWNRIYNVRRHFDKNCDKLEGYRAKIVKAEVNGTIFADDKVVNELKSMVAHSVITLKAMRDIMRQYPQLKLRKKTMEQITHIIRTASDLLARIESMNLKNAVDPKKAEMSEYGIEFDITEVHRLFPGGRIKPR